MLNELTVRLLRPEEVPRAKSLICELHYLKNADLAGDQLCYVAEHGGQWLALIWWSAPALHLKAREQWIGWGLIQTRPGFTMSVRTGHGSTAAVSTRKTRWAAAPGQISPGILASRRMEPSW